MRIPPVKIHFSAQDREEIWARIQTCLDSGMISQHKNVQEFEERFAAYTGVKYAVGVSSGGSALEVGMRILSVGGKEVIVPTNTFLATASAVLLAGGRVRLADVDAASFSLSVSTLEQALTKDTVGVVIVHIGGMITPEILEIRRWCDDHGLWLYEDAAHAHGSEIYGKKAGRFGVAGAYSFFATKVMTSGEGGMVVTDDEDFARQVRTLRNYGKPEAWVTYHTHIGANWRMSEINATLGLVQLAHLDEFIAWRGRVAEMYTRLLEGVPGLTPVLPQGRTSWYKYILLLDEGIDRAKVKAAMRERGVSLAGEVYDIPLHQQPALKGLAEGKFPVAEDVCSRHICPPLYYGMTDEEVTFVVDTLKEVLEERRIRG